MRSTYPNVILRHITFISVYQRQISLETPYVVRSRLKSLLHGLHQRARQCVTPIQHLDISVDDENDVLTVLDAAFQTHESDYIQRYWTPPQVENTGVPTSLLDLRRNPRPNLLTGSGAVLVCGRPHNDGSRRPAAGRDLRTIPRVPLARFTPRAAARWDHVAGCEVRRWGCGCVR